MSDRPAFTAASEGSNERAVRDGTVNTTTGNGTVTAGDQSDLIEITAADHDGLIIEALSLGSITGGTAADITVSLWIGDNNATRSFSEARVYLTAQLTGGMMDLTQPVTVGADEKVIVQVDNGSSTDASVMGGLVHRTDPYQ